jgi:predicted Zn-dependent peptidase
LNRRLEALKREREQLLDEWASDRDDKDTRLKLLVRLMDLEEEINENIA